MQGRTHTEEGVWLVWVPERTHEFSEIGSTNLGSIYGKKLVHEYWVNTDKNS